MKPKPIGGGAINKAKTHCINGHPYDEINTVRDKYNKRYCRICRKASNARSHKKRMVEF